MVYCDLDLSDGSYYENVDTWPAERGVAYFASYVRYPDNAVVPRIRLCHFGGSVELPIEANLASLAPFGYSNVGSAMYKSTSWPTNAEAIPPGAVAHAMAADGRVEAGGPLIYHAILRTPFFPTSACPTDLNRGLSCPTDVKHVIARWKFAVDTASRTAQLLGAPAVIATRTVHWRDTWVLQNEVPGSAGPGFGALEGKWVEGRRYSFYVLGDEVVRFARPGAFESGIGGVESGRIRLEPEGWSPSSFNIASINGNVAGDTCLPLPPGLYSNKTGLIGTEEATVCPPGTFSTGGATAPSVCAAGTYSTAGASSCYAI
eukprot:tig00000042_g15578.t1